MIRKDFHYTFIAALLALSGPAFSQAPGSTSVDTIVSVAYQTYPGGDTQIVSSNDAGVTVSAHTAGVTLTPTAGALSINRYAKAVYSVTLRNTGSSTDTFSLTLHSAAGWSGILLNDTYGDGRLHGGKNALVPAQITLAVGSSLTMLLVEMPPTSFQNIMPGLATLKAVSGRDGAVAAQTSVQTTISAL